MQRNSVSSICNYLPAYVTYFSIISKPCTKDWTGALNKWKKEGKYENTASLKEHTKKTLFVSFFKYGVNAISLGYFMYLIARLKFLYQRLKFMYQKLEYLFNFLLRFPGLKIKQSIQLLHVIEIFRNYYFCWNFYFSTKFSLKVTNNEMHKDLCLNYNIGNFSIGIITANYYILKVINVHLKSI